MDYLDRKTYSHDINPENSEERILWLGTANVGIYRTNQFLLINKRKYNVIKENSWFETQGSFSIFFKKKLLINISFEGTQNTRSLIDYCVFHYNNRTYKAERHLNSFVSNHKGIIKIFHEEKLVLELRETNLSIWHSNFKDNGIITCYSDHVTEECEVLMLVALIAKEQLKSKPF